MSKYAPSRVQTHMHLGAILMSNLYQRCFNPGKALSRDAWDMWGYCIDAYEELPAGSMEYYEFGPEADDWCWAATTCMREDAV